MATPFVPQPAGIVVENRSYAQPPRATFRSFGEASGATYESTFESHYREDGGYGGYGGEYGAYEVGRDGSDSESSYSESTDEYEFDDEF